MAFLIIDETTTITGSEVKRKPVIINGRVYNLVSTGRTTILSEEADTFLRIPSTPTIQQGKVMNGITAIRVKKTGAGPKTHLWEMHHVGRQHRSQIDHLDLLLILPREGSIITLQFSKRGELDFAHYDTEKIYLGIRLHRDEILRIIAKNKSYFQATVTSNHNWKLLRNPTHCRNQTWHNTATVVA